MLAEFFSSIPSLKICGVTTPEDAAHLAGMGVSAIGINFWPPSRRHCPPEKARLFCPLVAGKILRVGVFVNNARPLADDLFEEGLIDVVQLHGDEALADIEHFLTKGIPVIRAVGATDLPAHPLPSRNFALLIDTPAGKEYGGTGKTFDWKIAREFIADHPGLPVILAGGLTPENAAEALAATSPAALDIASGAELAPGRKDFHKVAALLEMIAP